jgi:hypothetical protein
MTFINSVGESYKFAHKTLSGIISNVRDHGHVNGGEGAESALGIILQGFKECEKINNNQDVDVEGFFLDRETRSRICKSKIDIKKPSDADLIDALDVLEEIKNKYYEKQNRVDLLSTTIRWTMIAPLMFILKDTDYYLEYLYPYGASNAFKSTNGRIMLAIDRHHDKTNYALKFTHVDSIAKFGNRIARTTFPISVDEMDLNLSVSGSRYSQKEQIINAIKISVDSKYPSKIRTTW